MLLPILSAPTPKHISSPTDLYSYASQVLPQLLSYRQSWVTLQSGQHSGVPNSTLPLGRKLTELGGKTCPEKEPALFLIMKTRKVWICFISTTQKQLTLRF